MVTSTIRLGRSAHGEVGDLKAGARRRRAAGRPAVTDVSRPCRTTLHPGGQPATRLGGDCLDGAATAPHAVTGRPPGQEEDATSLTGAEPEHTAVARGPRMRGQRRARGAGLVPHMSGLASNARGAGVGSAIWSHPSQWPPWCSPGPDSARGGVVHDGAVADDSQPSNRASRAPIDVVPVARSHPTGHVLRFLAPAQGRPLWRPVNLGHRVLICGLPLVSGGADVRGIPWRGSARSALW